MDLCFDAITWYHLLAAADVLLVTLGIAAFIAVSRKRIPSPIPMSVIGPYIEPGAECTYFAQSWKVRWRTSTDHVVRRTFSNNLLLVIVISLRPVAL